MVCTDCQGGQHLTCRERARQQTIPTSLTDTERAGSAWCDCQHQPAAAKKEEATHA